MTTQEPNEPAWKLRLRQRRRRFQQPTPRVDRSQWKIRYRDAAGRRHTKCLGSIASVTEAEAKRMAAEFLKPINNDHYRRGDKTLQTVIAVWRETVKPGLKATTARTYEWGIKRLAKAGLTDAPLVALGRADIHTFLATEATGIAPTTLHSLKACLSGLLTLAVEWEWIENHPMRGARFRGLPAAQSVRKRFALTPTQVKVLAGAVEQRGRTAVLVAVLTGLRRGELAALRWDDVKAEAVHVNENYTCGAITTPKTRKSRRPVEVDPEVIRMLEAWRPHADSVYVFERKGKPSDLLELLRTIQEQCRALELPVIGWHDLRHTYTSWGGIKGVPATVMRDLLGHSSVLMTQDIYTFGLPSPQGSGAFHHAVLP